MSSKMPPVPPAERSPKGSGSDPDVPGRDTGPKGRQRPDQPGQVGETGNIRQNTTNEGLQQDR